MTPQNDKLKSIIEEFRDKFPIASFTWNGDSKIGLESAKSSRMRVKAFLLSKLTEYGASEREGGWKEHCEGNHKSSLCPNCVRAGREEAIRECVELIANGDYRLDTNVGRDRTLKALLSLQKTSKEEK